MTTDGWLTVRQVAEYLGYSEDIVRELAAAGEIPGTRRPTPKGQAPWRFRRSAVDRWLERSADQETQPA